MVQGLLGSEGRIILTAWHKATTKAFSAAPHQQELYKHVLSACTATAVTKTEPEEAIALRTDSTKPKEPQQRARPRKKTNIKTP